MTRRYKFATATVLLGLGLGAAWAGEKASRVAPETTYSTVEGLPRDPSPSPESGLTPALSCIPLGEDIGITGQLLAPVSLNFQGAPLRHVLDDLQELTGVNIVLDTDALQEDNVDPDPPVTIEVEQVSLVSVLNRLMDQFSLTYGIKGDCIEITRRAVRTASLRPEDSERAIQQRLSMPVDVNLKDAPLTDVVDILRGISGMNVVLDVAALQEAAISQEQRLSLDVEKMSLKSVLNILLKQAGLTYVIKDEALQITTAERAKGKKKVVTYPVIDIILPIGGGTSELPPAFCRHDAEIVAKRRTYEDALLKLIISTVEPESWVGQGGKGTIQYFPLGQAIVVNQTADVQEQVAELLATIRRLQAKEDREYQLISTLVELRPDGERNEQSWPRVTFVRGQLITLSVGRAVALNDGSIHDLIPDDGCSHEAATGTNQLEPILVGTTLKALLTAVGEDGLRLDVTLQESDLVEANGEGLHASGQYHRLVKRVQPGKPVKLVLSQDENGTARKWVEFTVNEVPNEEEEQIFQGALPPIPR